ncbi:MAG: hypothetical protein ABI376_00150 [Caulobacteraceae bacterium]
MPQAHSPARVALGAAATGFIAGFAFPHARKAMIQAPSVAAGDWADARRFCDAVDRHIHEEEDNVFPAFRKAMTAAQNARLTAMLNWEGFEVA